MLWGAGLGFIIGLFAVDIRDTIHHKGPGVVHYGDGERSPEWSEEVDEAQYKHNHYVGSSFMLGIGLMFWFIVAKSARDNTAKAEAKEKYLEAQLGRAFAYHDAFASAIDGDMKSIARAEAISSDEVREADIDLELASRIFYSASRTAEGEEN